MEDLRALGKLVKRLSEEQNVSVEELGRLIQCNSEQVEQLYHGNLFIAFDQLAAIARRFDVSIDDLLRGRKAS